MPCIDRGTVNVCCSNRGSNIRYMFYLRVKLKCKSRFFVVAVMLLLMFLVMVFVRFRVDKFKSRGCRRRWKYV